MNKLTLNEFISRAKIIHKDKYDYSKTEYINSNTKVIIICKKHGEFLQTPFTHLQSRGCRKCFDDKHSKQFLHSELYILDKFKVIHNNKYIYPNFKYKGLRHKIKIICSIHGEFNQLAQSHLNGNGCPACSNVKPHTVESFVKKVSEIHNNKYDYSLVKYVNNNTKVKIICPEHGIFEQTPRGHLTYGCPKCHIRGYSRDNWIKVAEKNKNSILYIIKCFDKKEEFIKIGITTKSVKERFPSKTDMPYNYKTLIEYNYDPFTIWEFEKKLHRDLNKDYSYTPRKYFSGMYECFDMYALEALSNLFVD